MTVLDEPERPEGVDVASVMTGPASNTKPPERPPSPRLAGATRPPFTKTRWAMALPGRMKALSLHPQVQSVKRRYATVGQLTAIYLCVRALLLVADILAAHVSYGGHLGGPVGPGIAISTSASPRADTQR